MARPKLDSSTDVARLDERVSSLEDDAERGEREHERLQTEYGQMMRVIVELQGDVSYIKSAVELQNKRKSDPNISTGSNHMHPGLVGLAVILAQTLAECVKFLIHLH